MSFVGYTIFCGECGYMKIRNLRITQSELMQRKSSWICPKCGAQYWESYWVCDCNVEEGEGEHVDLGDSCMNCGSREPSSGGGGCFLTTVVCSVLGYDDNCVALDNLRKFRNGVLEKTDDGQKLLFEYKKVSDIIAPKILSDDSRNTLCEYVYNSYITPVNILVNENRNEEAIEKYKEMVTYFMRRYEINKSE
jgi:hypothetical protein